MRTPELFKVIAMLLLGLSPRASAQPAVEVKAIKFAKLYPNLQRTFLKNAGLGLDKSAYYNRREGIFYFIDRSGQQIQAFDLKSLGLYGPGHKAWSPDGTMMLCSIKNRNKGGASPLYLLKLDGTIEEVVSAEGSREQILQPCWSYDGKMFAYLESSTRVGHEIWVKNIESGEDILVERVPIGEGHCGNPVWFNRHKRVLYKKAKANRPTYLYSELWIFDVGTKEKKKIYEGRIDTTFPIISPDDALIGIDIGKYFSLLDVNGNVIKILEPGSNIKPSWSPDGLNIAYLKGIVDPLSERLIEQHIHIININTGIDKDLTPVPGLKIDEFRWYNETTIVY